MVTIKLEKFTKSILMPEINIKKHATPYAEFFDGLPKGHQSNTICNLFFKEYYDKQHTLKINVISLTLFVDLVKIQYGVYEHVVVPVEDYGYFKNMVIEAIKQMPADIDSGVAVYSESSDGGFIPLYGDYKEGKILEKAESGVGVDLNDSITEYDEVPPEVPAEPFAENPIHSVVVAISSILSNKKEGSKVNLADGGEFYNVVSGTSPGSRYVIIGKAKNGDGYLAMRYKDNSLSLRCDPVPEGSFHALELVGFQSSGGSHVSCHFQIPEGLPLERFFILLKTALADGFELCDFNMNKIKSLGG